ncbi:MAG TPA: hypothetical protein VFF49_11375 [Thermodesulfobacteriota bacterium]|nr:hypothetical protein [Thermodesulfobacteriota bacterium]
MKILCVCRLGNNRSVWTKRALNDRGYKDVLSVGGLLVSKETLNMLCEWADEILLAKPEHGENIYHKYHKKINKHFYIGDDLETRAKKQLDLIELK